MNGPAFEMIGKGLNQPVEKDKGKRKGRHVAVFPAGGEHFQTGSVLTGEGKTFPSELEPSKRAPQRDKKILLSPVHGQEDPSDDKGAFERIFFTRVMTNPGLEPVILAQEIFPDREAIQQGLISEREILEVKNAVNPAFFLFIFTVTQAVYPSAALQLQRPTARQSRPVGDTDPADLLLDPGFVEGPDEEVLHQSRQAELRLPDDACRLKFLECNQNKPPGIFSHSPFMKSRTDPGPRSIPNTLSIIDFPLFCW